MNMKFKFLVFILISSCLFVSAQTSNKKSCIRKSGATTCSIITIHFVNES